MKTEYIVQFNHPDMDRWVEDECFDSLREAMAYIASECLQSPTYDHRVVVERISLDEIVTIPALECKI